MLKKNSLLMNFFIKIRCDSIAWCLRWLYCPVKKKDLVLEVGSGGSPYFRSNILCDAHIHTGERHFVPLVSDRPTVLAFAENLPFKDNSFDFVIASHVLEHSENPERFIDELQRVAKAGYIEVPDAFMERLTNYEMHKLEISESYDYLIIRKKTAPITDPDLDKLFKKTKHIFPYWLSKFPFNFHIRYYWNKESGGIKYKIINPEYKFDWKYDDNKTLKKTTTNLKIKFKQSVLKFLRMILSQNKRNKKINIYQYLMCTKCKSTNLNKTTNIIICNNCKNKIEILPCNIINFTKK